jgi:Fe-S-cluster containining protein
VVLYPPFDKPETYGTETEADGTIVLTRQNDGQCLYLHKGACLIYHRRPLTCRAFDCRALLVADVPTPAHIFAAASEKFEMVFKQPGDRTFAADAQKAARIAYANGQTAEQQLREALYSPTVLR